MKGSDHRTSLEPLEFQHLVQSIRQVEEALGKPEKRVWPSEVKNREKLSKSVVSACYLKHGTVLQLEMVAFKSPGTGISPSRLSDLIGRVILHNIPQDTLIQEEYLTRVHSYSSNFSGASS